MAVMPIDVKTTTAKFIQLVAIEKVMSAAAINTITLCPPVYCMTPNFV